MKARVLFLAKVIGVAAMPVTMHCTTWYVDGSVKRSGDGLSWATAFKTIQEGIDAAADDHTVTVRPGRYRENISFRGKRIVLESTEWRSLTAVRETIMDGQGIGSVATFASGEGRGSLLRGFTITNGLGYGGLGGGILCINGSSPTIANNVIESNAAEQGGGIYVGEGPSDALKVSPGGHYFTYKGKTVMLVGDSGTQCVMQNLNIDYRQWIDDLAAKGVNAVHIWALLAPRQKQDGSVVEARYGYVYPGATPWRRRTAGSNATDQLRQWDLTQFDEGTDPNAHYWPRLRDLVAYAKRKETGVGITLFFGWPKWDTPQRPDWSYHPFNVVNGGHLSDNDAVQIIESPGQEVLTEKWSASWPPAKKTQWIWEKYCEKMITDVGLYGNVFFVFMDEHSYSEGNCGDHFMNFFKKRGQIYVDWGARREGVDAVYTATSSSTNRNSRTVSEFNELPARPIMLLEGPPYELGSPGLRQSMWTLAIGGGHFFFHDDQDQGTPQTGIMGYDANVKGGVKPLKTYDWLGIMARFFNTKVLALDKMAPRNDLIAGGTDAYCLANPGSDYAVYLRSGGQVTLKLADASGETLAVEWLNPDSGEYISGGTITGRKLVTLVPPSSPERDWVVHVFTAGEAATGRADESRRKVPSGTVMCGSGSTPAVANGLGSPLIISNRIIQNGAIEGGGVFLARSSAVLANNLVQENSAETRGGAIHFAEDCSPTVVNCTIVQNVAEECGGGVYSLGQSAIIINSILWSNGDDLVGCSANYSLIENSGAHNEGTGNVHGNPLFLNPITGDFRLRPASPCIDAGDNHAAELPATDLRGFRRILYGGKRLSVDMGALEFCMGPPQMDAASGDVKLEWSSVAGKSYSVHYSTDLASWLVANDNVLSEGDAFTSWLDQEIFPGLPQRFYRIVENP